MLSGFLEAQPPTIATWSALYNVYNIFGFIAAIVVMAYFVFVMIRYRRRKNAPPVPHQAEKPWGDWKKIVLTLAITGSVLTVVEYQTFQSESLFVLPQTADALHIGVVGQQWSWTFVYPNGAKIVGNLTVPEGKTVILNITSIDVAHSFSIPDLAVGRDALPGTYNNAWFTAPANHVVYTIRCKELCGTGHAFMVGKLTVVDPTAYGAWYSSLGGK